MNLLDKVQIVSGFLPVDLQDGANTGDVVSMKNYGHLTVVFFKNVGTAGDDPTLTLLQGTDVAFGTNKALNFTSVWTKQDTVLTSTGTFTENTQDAANEFTDDSSAEDAAIWVVEIDAADLDVENGYDCVRASVADVGTNEQLGCLLYLLSEPRYAGSTLPRCSFRKFLVS